MSIYPSVSVVIPVRNGARFLPACLDALQAQQGELPDVVLRIVAVDNASADGSADLIATHYPAVQLIRNRENRGFSGGCNQGIQAVPSDVAILLNQDTVVQSGWLRAILAALAADPQIGIVGCKILYPDGKTIQHAGGYIERPLLAVHHYHYRAEDVGQGDQSQAVEFVTGAAFAIRRQLVAQIGLLDEAFWPGYYEDVDYCLRAQAAGYRVWYCAEAVVIHQETSSKLLDDAVHFFYQRGRLRLVLKHTPPAQLLAEYFPAEQASTAGNLQIRQRAIFDILAHVAILLKTHWQASDAQIGQVVAAFHRVGTADSLLPTLEEFDFHSPTPVIGPLITAVRRAWYNVAARWGVRHLQMQQERINQDHARQLQLANDRIRDLQGQVDQLVLTAAALQQQLALLQQKNK